MERLIVYQRIMYPNGVCISVAALISIQSRVIIFILKINESFFLK